MKKMKRIRWKQKEKKTGELEWGGSPLCTFTVIQKEDEKGKETWQRVLPAGSQSKER